MKETICRTGPGCRLHSPAQSILQVTKTRNIQTLNQFFPQTKTREPNPESFYAKFYTLSRDIEKLANQQLEKTTGHHPSYYTRSGYEIINAYLREGEQGFNTQYAKYANLDPNRTHDYTKPLQEVKQDIQIMDEWFNRYQQKFDKPVLTYRAIDLTNKLGDKETLYDYAKRTYTPGLEINDKAYVSTSIDPAFMTFFKKPNKKTQKHVVFEILTHTGLPMFNNNYLNNDTAHEIGRYSSLQDFEREILLNRDTKFMVVGVKNVSFTHNYPQVATIGNHNLRGIPQTASYPVVQLIQK